MGKKKYDFSGWATKYGIECSDGRIISSEAFAHMDKGKIPLVWNHEHNSDNTSTNVLGYAILEHRNNEGMYAYGYFNDTPKGINAKELVRHGDIDSLSIYANKLKQNSNHVVHGVIRELSLVLAGANPGAVIQEVLYHSDNTLSAAVIHTDNNEILHSDVEEPKEISENKKPEEEEEMPTKDENTKDETIKEVIDSMTDKQRNVLYGLVGAAIDGELTNINDVDNEEDDNEEEEEMKHNAFEGNGIGGNDTNVLQHADIINIIDDARKGGKNSLKEEFLAHGITNLEVLFPEAQAVGAPQTIQRDQGWVNNLLNGARKVPFSKIKSRHFDITEEDARAKGYIKGEQKVEEFFLALTRETTPQTVYKLQKLDRDDILDINDFDIVYYMKQEMRLMLDEEIARAALVGDGRQAMDKAKIKETNIRPILGDDELYTIKKIVTVSDKDTTDARADKLADAIIRSRKDYKGTGNPDFYANEDIIADLLLAKDGIGRRLYPTVTELATALRVNSVIAVPVMDNLKTKAGNPVLGIMVNMGDYVFGSQKGGEINFFDDFDLNFNKHEYLIETRVSGALDTPKSAVTFELKVEVTTEEAQG